MPLEEDLAAIARKHCHNFHDDLMRVMKAYGLPEIPQSSGNMNTSMKSESLNKRITCLIDGDGAIFNDALLCRGFGGGVDAVASLTRVIHGHFPPIPDHEYELRVWVFLNQRGLESILANCGMIQASTKLREFITGFNSCSAMFAMINVGGRKEAVDYKIQTYLPVEAKSSRTTHIVFGGCHDVGYVNTLIDLKTHGYGEKIYFLEYYDSIPPLLQGLHFPILPNKGLFLREKLVGPPLVNNPDAERTTRNGRGRQRSRSEPPSPASRRVDASSEELSPPLSLEHPRLKPLIGVSSNCHPSDIGEPRSASCASELLWNDGASTVFTEPETISPESLDEAKAYADLLKNGKNQASTPRRRATMPKPKKIRYVNTALPIHQQQPRVCAFFYLQGKCTTVDCSKAHDYDLTKQYREALRTYFKSIPCRFGHGVRCTRGDDCLFGHKIV
ncbi:hypothetical protein BC629DRAFT_734143 [Irpex lacteus]|nr:hypothetical protein BC629DRAFT_734143 [Irpex lacteus]